MQSFLAVAKTKSISKASQQMHITQPALSLRLRKMEEGLGFSLFKRDWKGVKLTKQGNYFLPYAIQLLQDLNNASNVLTSYLKENMISFEEVTNNTNRLYIGIDEWLHPLFIKPIIELLNNEYPSLEYKFITKPSQVIIDLLEYKGVHLGIFYSSEPKQSHKTKLLIENDEMYLLYCEDEEFNINKDLTNINLLQNEPFILFDNPILIYHSHITKSIIELLNIEKFNVVDDFNVMLNIINIGKGYTVVPKSSIYKQLSNPSFSLAYLPIKQKMPKINIQLTYSDEGHFLEPIKRIFEVLSIYVKKEYL